MLGSLGSGPAAVLSPLPLSAASRAPVHRPGLLLDSNDRVRRPLPPHVCRVVRTLGSGRAGPLERLQMPQPNMQQMLKQVQKMQQEVLAAQESLKDEVVDASAGGGMVTVEVTGDLRVKSVKIASEAIDPDDPELLQDMVLAAVNEGIRAAQELASSKLGGITGGPGALGLEAGAPAARPGAPGLGRAPPG